MTGAGWGVNSPAAGPCHPRELSWVDSRAAGMTPYLEVCLAVDILDLVDPRLWFAIIEYGHRTVRRGWGRGERGGNWNGRPRGAPGKSVAGACARVTIPSGRVGPRCRLCYQP